MLHLRNILLCTLFSILAIAVEAKTAISPDSITIFGRVLCEGKPVANVQVSDGVHIVQTDSLGRYQIASNKLQNVVFITTPSGYEPLCNKRILPKFWALLEKKREVAEQHDFHIVKREQGNHRTIFMSNIALQNSNEDLLQFKRRTIPAARELVKEVGDSTAVYTILLGDISNCSTWYSREFDISDVISLIATLRYPTMVYTVMGDQDNDGAIPGTGLTDYYAERQYVYACGPKYFAMNIGEVHYIVLDNTVFRNEPGKGSYPAEIVGKRNYDRFITADQLDWLRKDLALVKDKSKPVVVCLHHPTFQTNSRNRVSKRYTKPEQSDSLMVCFKDFSNVHFVSSGASQRKVSHTTEPTKIVEHALAPTSGNRWITSYNGFELISTSGEPAGFEIFDIKGEKITWHHRSDKGDSKPFRVYDIASVGDYYRENLDVQNLLREHANTFINYATPDFTKYIYINWWGAEEGGKLEVFEDNQPLRVQQIHQADPLYVVTSPAITQKHSRNNSRFSRNNCPHLYRVARKSPESVIRVRATSPFGEICEEVFVGNKVFTPTAK